MKFSDELDFNSVVTGNLFRIFPDLLCKGLGETGIVKNTEII